MIGVGAGRQEVPRAETEVAARMTSILLVGNLYDDPIPKFISARVAGALREVPCEVAIISGESFTKGSAQSERVARIRKAGSVLGLAFESLRRQVGAVTQMQRHRFDVGIVMLPFLLLPCLYVRVRGRPLWIHVGGRASKSLEGEIRRGSRRVWPTYMVMRLVEHIAFSLADHIITESSAGVRFLGLEDYATKLAIGGQYVDLERFTIKRPLSERKKTVGYIGRLSREKGVGEFVQAAAIVASRRQDIDFILVGTGPLAQTIVDSAEGNPNLRTRIRIAGWVAQNLMPGILNDLTLLVLPSYSEGIPAAVLEAMACGTPVLASRVGGIPDVLVDSSTGFLLDSTNPSHIAETIECTLDCKHLEEVARNAREVVEKRFSLETALRFYRRMVSEVGDERG